METPRIIITLFFTVAMGSLASALSRSDAPLEWYEWSYAVFFTIFRLKMFLDDLDQFKAHRERTVLFQFGMVVGVASWILWITSATIVDDLHKALGYLIAAYFLSTVWLGVELVEHLRGKDRDSYCRPQDKGLLPNPPSECDLHVFWIVVNVFIMSLFSTAYFANWDKEAIGYIFIYAAAIIIVDAVVCDSLKTLINESREVGADSPLLNFDAMKTVMTVFLTIGLSTLAAALPKVTFYVWCWAGFLASFRIKIFLDQMGYYKKLNGNEIMFRLNFVVGLVAWFLWFVSVDLLRQPTASVWFILLVVIVSSAWLITRMAHRLYEDQKRTDEEKRKETPRRKEEGRREFIKLAGWLLSNLIIVTVLSFYLPRVDRKLLMIWVSLTLIVLMAVNGIFSKSLSALEDEESEDEQPAKPASQ